MNDLHSSGAASENLSPTPSDVAFSCRLPLMVLFISAAVWLIIGSVFALIASIKFHSPDFLADVSWLTYGRVRPAYLNSVLYGFCLQAGFGVALWLLAQLGRTPLAQRWLVTAGAMLWNLGVTVGVLGILAGDSTGFANLEMPPYGAVLAFLGYVLIGVWGVVTFHQRRERPLFVSQWFVFTALFWFPWIYSTANLLLVTFPVRGILQSVIVWWYSENLLIVWLGLAGVATAFYFVPKLLNRELHSHYLALLAFWMLILFASWGGIPNAAPVPAWMTVMSTVATVLTIVPLIAVGLNVYQTVKVTVQVPRTTPPHRSADASSACSSETATHGRGVRAPVHPSLSFILFGITAFVLAGLMRIAGVLLDTNQTLHFTSFNSANSQLNFYGFFAMVMFGAIYFILPQLTGVEFPRPKLVRAHFWLAAVGIVLIVLPLAIGGVIQALQLQDPAILFPTIMKTMLQFLRVSTIGDLLLMLGHLVFFGNLLALANRFYRSRVEAAYARATADLFQAAEAKP